MEQSRERRETPSPESPRDSEQQVLFLPTWFISWLGTLAQESALHHLYFPKILLPSTCVLRNNSCLTQPWGHAAEQRHFRSQTSSPPFPPLLFLSNVLSFLHSSRPPSSSKYHPGATPRTLLAMFQGFLTGYSPQHTPPMGFVLCLRGFSHRDTQPSGPLSSSHPQIPGPHSSPASPGHNNPTPRSFPRSPSRCHPVHRVSLIPPSSSAFISPKNHNFPTFPLRLDHTL